MTYSYESLSPQRFQQLCQALVLETFPSAQCLPVDQADGGRDALQVTKPFNRSKPTVVFQVKFNRKALAERRPHTWLHSTLEEEKPSINRLAAEGMERYILITNVPGTASPVEGSIDKVQSILDQAIPVASQCWWRDDLDRRLENSPSVRWDYPEILTGQDVIAAILTSGLSDNRERRDNAIRAYVTSQFHADEEVRFKQVDLKNDLFDLFIDVPIALEHDYTMQLLAASDKHGSETVLDGELLADALVKQRRRIMAEPFRGYVLAIGAASALLRPAVQERIRRLVLEGAPGQGKSTIAQYLCQVHRTRLLNRRDREKVPPEHLESPVRLPLKADLRDFAVWLEGRDLFSSQTDGRPPDWRPSLEAFLAAHISHFAGGAPFTVADLHAVAKVSHLLLVLDGFDEVADVESRRNVVDAIGKAADRLEELASSFQVIITSRPAAFANSPGFPPKLFHHLELGDVTKDQALEYANKWAVAKGLEGQERTDFIQTLHSKLEEVHLHELARNPMQLAILLSLILTRGVSLPEERTAMYLSYFEVFIGREAEKTPVVREYRRLIINVHGYLAWRLHLAAEEGKNQGSIPQETLQRLLVEYLAREGQDVEFVEQFFTGMVERVGVLVSGVQGLFEFEVQPLREYFAARHLYETAPYSPPGREAVGTLPERFDVIGRNFYWLNVTRSYAGCYSRGELAALVDSLQELIEADGYRHISFPRRLCKMLLNDWVFSQQPRMVNEVVHLMTSGSGFKFLLGAEEPFYGVRDLFQLPERCGRRALLERGYDELARAIQADYIFGLSQVIEANAVGEEKEKLWWNRWEAIWENCDARRHWLRCGHALGVFSRLGAEFELLWETICDDERAVRPVLQGVAMCIARRAQRGLR